MGSQEMSDPSWTNLFEHKSTEQVKDYFKLVSFCDNVDQNKIVHINIFHINQNGV